jgi:hypothetical protein
VKEILLAALGVLGVAIPSVIQLMTGESRRVSNMAATAQLLKELPDDDPELEGTRDWLRHALGHEARLDKKTSHRPFLWCGAGIFALCLVFTYLVMQPPGQDDEQDKWRSLFILLALITYVVGAAVFVHGVHLLGRRYHLFSGSVPDKP